MATPTYTALATITLSSSASSVTFSSIPSTYRDLVLVVAGTSDTNRTLEMELNGDTGSNYSYVIATGPTESVAATGKAIGRIETTQCTNIIQIMDYSATDKHKTSLYRANVNNSQVWMGASRYSSTTAVSSVKLFIGVGSFASSSTFSLFGIEA